MTKRSININMHKEPSNQSALAAMRILKAREQRKKLKKHQKKFKKTWKRR